ncbi:MAG TPA: thioredoxin domain-containing protein [Candidatus Acidoferrales bacterium]|nr:thioredoxin domain-containing protein [Candidatus Acidoferrales bacterium]
MSRKSSLSLISIATMIAGLLICFTGFLSAQQGPPQSHVRVAPVNFRTAKTIGSSSAPILLEDFSDYQCPSCRFFFLNTTLQVIKDYVGAGKVYIIHHDFPLEMHAHSMEAARFANAAAEIGKFQEVETALYTTQASWENTGKIEDAVSSVFTPAELKRVEGLMGKPDVQAAIDEDMALGKQRGITQTPSIFVTYKGQTNPLPPGGVTYAVLKQYFDFLLTH